MLSTTAEHALRALVCLVRKSGTKPVLGHDLALQANVPRNYLSKIFHDLKRAGIVEATRGTGGGYRLQKSAEDIRLLDIVELFDGPLTRTACLLGRRQLCSDQAGCAAHSSWLKVRATYLDFLEKTTLAEIVGWEPS